MSHYQKLATLALRLVAFVILAIGVMGLLYCGYCLGVYHAPSSVIGGRLLSSVIFALVGLVSYVLSPLLGRHVGRGL